MMPTWKYEETVPTTAGSEQIWTLWSKPDEWNRWDDGLEWIIFDGPFENGKKGRLKPVASPVVKFVILEVQKNRGFRGPILFEHDAYGFYSHLYAERLA